MAYASAAKGFRLGGINAFPTDLCAQSLAALHISPESAGEYNSDSLWSYELGVKSEFADQRIRLNGAATTLIGRIYSKTFSWNVATISP